MISSAAFSRTLTLSITARHSDHRLKGVDLSKIERQVYKHFESSISDLVGSDISCGSLTLYLDSTQLPGRLSADEVAPLTVEWELEIDEHRERPPAPTSLPPP